MNPYLSRDEKEQLIRLITLRVVFDKVIDLYAGLKSTDKKFLAELRHAKTRMDNAIFIRRNYLDKKAEENLYLSAAKMHLMFLPTPEATRAHKDLLQMKTTLPMSLEDFQDWYEFVIEHTCKTCSRADYDSCPARRVLMKYDVFPVNPDAQGCCQYSYVEDKQEEGVGAVGEAILQAMRKAAG